ncbi:hypothetical protein ACDT17_08280 [Chromobacterium piscinae]|uniref:hypothetical protein n=1 Tax=Chromobacterium piscinae TaxID=686831 RepID=UPI0035588727
MERQTSLAGQLAAIVGLVVAILLCASLFSLYQLWGGIRTFRDQVAADQQSVRQVLTMQVDFKKQVQEWKDTLLRGQDPAKLAKYWGNFEKKEGQVHDEGAALAASVSDPQAQQLLQQFVAAHQKMGEDYRRGLEAFKQSGGDAKVGDKQVAGMDRPPTDLLTQASDLLAKRAKADAADAEASANAARQRQRRAVAGGGRDGHRHRAGAGLLPVLRQLHHHPPRPPGGRRPDPAGRRRLHPAVPAWANG